MKILSFIIPSYNSEQFLDKCIPSMLVPEILSKIEIIVVNDGSTDGTVAVATKYCKQHPDTVRLISQENKGHGGALNTGCAAASGKYLKVIDADDWVVSENLPAFIEALECCESDVVLTHHHTIDISTGEIKHRRSYPPEFGKAYTFETIMSDWRGFYSCMTFHGITYRTTFYKKNSISLSEHVFYEDYEYATFPCCRALTITPLDLFIYNYRIGDVNQSVSAANKLKRIGHLETVLNRLIQENRFTSGLSANAKNYIIVKTQELLLSYFTTVLLIESNKRIGRQAAAKMMAHMQNEMPEVATLAHKKYLFFTILNHLHISKSAWDAILVSRLYNRLRGNHDFT